MDCNLDKNLFESLSPSEEEKEPSASEKKELVSECRDCVHIGPEGVCLRKEEIGENLNEDDSPDTAHGLTSDSEGCQIKSGASTGPSCSKAEDIVNKEKINSSEAKHSVQQSKPVGITIDEAFNEEDEIEKESSEEEEDYESAEEEHLTPEEAEVLKHSNLKYKKVGTTPMYEV